MRLFSDGVFAVLITILVLDLKPPDADTFSALFPLWPTGLLRMRSFVTIGVFAAAALVALKWPVVAMGLICACLVGYLRPDIPAPNPGVDPA